jgi:hypothetical protein
MILEDRFQPFARTFRPGGNRHPPAAAADVVGMGLHRLIDIAARLRALRGEAAAAPAAEGDGIGALEGREGKHRVVGLALRPLRLRDVERIGLHGLVGCCAEGFLPVEGLHAGIVEFGDLLLPCGRRLIRRVVERHDGIVQIVEQRREPVVEQRQPVLHALVLAPGGDAFIERVAGVDAAEGFGVVHAEAADRGSFSSTSFAGLRVKRLRVVVVRWDSGSKLRIDSSVSPKKSRRTG